MSQSNNNEIEQLFETVVLGGYCIGCGVCASLPDSPIKMEMDKYGCFQAKFAKESPDKKPQISVLNVCPFSEESANEDQIAQQLFASHTTYHDRIGYYMNTYAGYVIQEGYRERGSSGGMGSWILAELFNHNLIDGVLHIHQCNPTENDKRLFKYYISTSLEEIQAGSKSRYYPVELSEVLHLVRQQPKRYALVGVPCFIKAVRLLAQEDPIIRESVLFYIGLICGHLKSIRFTDRFGWRLGIKPGNISEIDFRYKLLHRKASRYGVKVTGQFNGKKATFIKPVDEFFGFQWGYGFFKYQACDYCDDVMSETADVTVGDAWLPRYNRDSRGTNLVVVRHPTVQQIVEDGLTTRCLRLNRISPDKVVQSQQAAFRHRRGGLAYRLYLKDRDGVWRPEKRVTPQSNHLDARRKKIYEHRLLLTAQSHQAFLEAIHVDSFSVFRNKMEPLMQDYEALYLSGWHRWPLQGKRLIMHMYDELYWAKWRKWVSQGKRLIGRLVSRK